MKPEYIYQSDNPADYSNQELLQLYPDARAEILGLALAFHEGKSALTAGQLRMLVQLADRAYELLQGGNTDVSFPRTPPFGLSSS